MKKIRTDYGNSLERLVEVQERIRDTGDYFVFLQMYESWIKKELEKEYYKRSFSDAKYQGAKVVTALKDRKVLSLKVVMQNGDEEEPELSEYHQSVFINSLIVFRMTGELKLDLANG